jgi:D-inositol-3-phosphate glycosyltransferase
MTADKRQIALISVHGDPAIEIGKEEAGGQNVYVRQVGEALARLGWQVEMFTRRSHEQQPEVVEHLPGCRTIRLTAGPPEFIPRDELFGYLPTFVTEFLKFQEEAGIQYEIVHTNYWLSSWVGMTLKKLQGVKQVHTHHSLGAVKYRSVPTQPPIATTRLETETRCMMTAERLIATSPNEAEDIQSYIKTPLTNISVIPCGTDVDRFGSISQDVARDKLGIAPDAKVVFYIGRFDPRKGIETLVRAASRSQFRSDPKFQLVIGGGSRPGQADGDERDRIEALVDELGLRSVTQFAGRIPDELMPAYYAAADIVGVPSHYEPFGLVAIEAMACRTPLVASAVGGLLYSVVPEETGLLVPVKDEVAFAAAIDRILGDRALSDRLGNAARDRVLASFSWNSVAKQLSQIYEELGKRQ